MADRVFIFHETTDNFRAFDFDGTAETSENWSPGFSEVSGAAADATRIVVLDVSASPPIARFFDENRVRQSGSDITMNSTDAYSGIALTDTHLVAINRTAEKLEYYDLTTRAYISAMDAVLPSRVSPEYYSGICRSGNFLYLVTHNDSTYQPRIYKRNLDGSAVSDWFGQASTTALTIFATTDRVAAVRKNGGHWDRWAFDGTQDTTLNTIGSGVWGASYTTFEPPAVLGIEAIDEQFITIGTEDYDLVINITGQPDTAKASGQMEGFGQHWDAVQGQLHIKSEEVTRLINGVNWDIEVAKDMQTLMGQVAYNVVQAAPIFASLETIHLYKGVPINFDIIIQNIPPLLIPDAELLGLKSELLEYGVNVKGEISATDNLAFSSGNVTIIVPSEDGSTDTRYNYAYEIEDGSPPQIMSLSFIPKGGYGILEFPDVTHALGYGWRLGTDDATPWNVFDSTREVIDPEQVEITHGHLNVTVKFPNVAGASGYAYMLESETHTVDWKAFTGTLDINGFIRTVIPNLEEGVTYDLHIRVDQPWQGVPITIQVTGGRLCYTLDVDFTTPRDSHYLYLYHTGHAHGGHASRIKRLLLPTALTHPDGGGLAVNSDGDVFIASLSAAVGGEKAIYTFLASTIENATDGSRLTQDRKNPFPSSLDRLYTLKGMAEYNGNLYTYSDRSAPADWSRLRVIPVPQLDGVELTTTGGSSTARSDGTVVSVTDESIWLISLFNRRLRPIPYDRTLFTRGAAVEMYWQDGTTPDSIQSGLKVIGEDFYNVVDATDNRIEIFRINPEVHATNHVLDFWLSLPSGFSHPRFLDVLV